MDRFFVRIAWISCPLSSEMLLLPRVLVGRHAAWRLGISKGDVAVRDQPDYQNNL